LLSFSMRKTRSGVGSADSSARAAAGIALAMIAGVAAATRIVLATTSALSPIERENKLENALAASCTCGVGVTVATTGCAPDASSTSATTVVSPPAPYRAARSFASRPFAH